MITVIGNTKGGVGKSTISVNLAIGLAGRGHDILLIDGDEQGTAMQFTELRSQHHPDTYTAVALHGASIRTQARQLRGRYDHIIIDVGGRDNGSLRHALFVADTIIIPCQPRSFDVWGVEQTKELVDQAREFNERLEMRAVLNGADPAGQDNEDAAQALRDMGIVVMPTILGRRKAYPNAAAQGLSVLEYMDWNNRKGCTQAAVEFANFVSAVNLMTCEEVKQ